MHTIVIVDFGSPHTQLIAERVRTANVFTEVVKPNQIPYASEDSIKGIILSDGTHQSSKTQLRLPDFVLEAGVPVLGVGLGMHLLVKSLGGKVSEVAPEWKEGKETLKLRTWSGFNFFSLTSTYSETFSHRDALTSLPKGFVSVAETHNFPHAAVANPTHDYYGFQFHPELSTHDYFTAFAITICQCDATWTMKRYLADKTAEIKTTLDGDKVYVPLTSCLEDIVGATLIYHAIGVRMECSMIKSPLLRKNEMDIIVTHVPFPINIIEMSDKLIYDLDNYNWGSDMEESRSELTCSEIRDIFGTLHMNDPQKKPTMRTLATSELGRCLVGSVNPLEGLYRTEIQQLGKELGLPEYLLTQTYLPLHGLASRCYSCGEKAIAILREADYQIYHIITPTINEKTTQLEVFLQRGNTLVISCKQKELTSTNLILLSPTIVRQISMFVKEQLPEVSKIYYDITM